MSKFTARLRQVGQAVIDTDLRDIGHGVRGAGRATVQGTKVVGSKTASVARKVVDAVTPDPDELQEAYEAVIALDKSDESPEAMATSERFATAVADAFDACGNDEKKLRKLHARLSEMQAKLTAELNPETVELADAIATLALVAGITPEELQALLTVPS